MTQYEIPVDSDTRLLIRPGQERGEVYLTLERDFGHPTRVKLGPKEARDAADALRLALRESQGTGQQERIE